MGPQPPPRPPRTEYTAFGVDSYEDLGTKLTDMSADGWELVQVMPRLDSLSGSGPSGATDTSGSIKISGSIKLDAYCSYIAIVRRPAQ